MKNKKTEARTRAQESSAAIEKLYIAMRHLFSRGFYKPMGVSGETLRKALLLLRPEIYGSIAEEKVELNGLTYVLDRLPIGIEECRYINLTADEGYSRSHFKCIIPSKRRRNCYRIDKDQMNIEVTRGRSEIYDILTHLTFLYIESHKILDRVLVKERTKTIREWDILEDIVLSNKKLEPKEREVVLAHIGNILGRTFEEVKSTYTYFSESKNPNRFFQIIYWLGHLAINEDTKNLKREITFSPLLREQIGHHIYGDEWADNIKEILNQNELLSRPIHIISANMHSVMNSIYAPIVLNDIYKKDDSIALFETLSADENDALRKKVKTFAGKNGLIYIPDDSGTNINVQVIDTRKINFDDATLFIKQF